MAPQIRKAKAGSGPPLTVVWRRIEVLRPDPASPRSHSPTQVSQLARSIRSFGFNVPILIDPTLRVIAGHGRLLAARDLGWREVPTILLGHLSAAQARAFAIADNHLAEGAAWNNGLLREQLTELPLAEPDLAIEVTGFELEGIDLRRAVRPRDVRRRSRRPAPAAASPGPPAAPPALASEAEEAPALMPAGARG
jgi:ParB-like nuclease family protein